MGSQQALGLHYQQVLPPPTLANTFDTIFHQVQQTRQVATFEYPLMLGQQQRYFHATVSPLASKTKYFEGVLSVTRDITDAKQAEVELLDTIMPRSIGDFGTALQKRVAGKGKFGISVKTASCSLSG